MSLTSRVRAPYRTCCFVVVWDLVWSEWVSGCVVGVRVSVWCGVVWVVGVRCTGTVGEGKLPPQGLDKKEKIKSSATQDTRNMRRNASATRIADCTQCNNSGPSCCQRSH